MSRREARGLLNAYWKARSMLENRPEQPSLTAAYEKAEEACLAAMNSAPETKKVSSAPATIYIDRFSTARIGTYCTDPLHANDSAYAAYTRTEP